jgi:hypothetical protein
MRNKIKRYIHKLTISLNRKGYKHIGYLIDTVTGKGILIAKKELR